jgi:hypothetical protein
MYIYIFKIKFTFYYFVMIYNIMSKKYIGKNISFERYSYNIDKLTCKIVNLTRKIWQSRKVLKLHLSKINKIAM